MFIEVIKTLLLIFLCGKYFRGTVLALTDPSESKLIFFYGPQFNDSMVYNLSDASSIPKNPNFVNQETHLYLHGYGTTQDSEIIHLTVEAYNKRKTVNLILIDMAKAFGENYFTSSYINIELLAPVLADSILDLYKAGVKRESLSLVGHSLGCQLSGLTARKVMEKTGGVVKIYRMYMLDAAFPLFFPPFLQTVTKDDAEFVQVIHSGSGSFGIPVSIGHVDFWPNGGGPVQPGCPENPIPLSEEDLCNHQITWHFWAEIIAPINGTKFLGFPSSSYKKFQEDGADNLKKQSIDMGLDCPIDARGNYYLKTNGQTPYAKGMDGY